MPASARDLNQSVDFLKDILKNETRTRSPGNFDDPISKLPTRSFHSDTGRGAGGRQDATVYKHNDDHTPPGGVYQPRSRHIDRDTVRTRSDDPTDDLSVMKRQLENTAKMLDRTTEENAARTREDDELEREMSDLRYRIKRLQDDLDYVSRGPRSYAKDDERRKLERELLHLMHEKLPDLEKRIEENQARKDKEKREQTRDRDRRNDRFGRFSNRDNEYSRRYDDEDRYRSSYGEDRSRERDRPRDDYDRRDYDRRDRDRDFDRSRDDDRDSDYRRPPPQDTRTPPPPPPNPPSNSVSQLPPAPPPPSSTPANMAKMTKEERQAYIKAEAQRQIQERMKALGVTTSASTPSIDSSIADRLAQEKKEAEEKAKAAERAEEERARARQERLANEKAIKEGKTLEPPSLAPAPDPPAPTISSPMKPPAPPPKTRARPPPPPTKSSRPSAPPAPTAPAPVISEPPPPPQPDPEEERIRRLEEESRKRREAMQARILALQEEEEAARKTEAEIEKRRQALSSRTPIESPSTPVPPPPPPPQPVQPVVQPPAPPVPVSPPTPEPPKSVPIEKPSFNPFSRIKKEESSMTIVPSPLVTTGGGSTNPFFRSQTAPPPIAPAPSSTSPAPKPYYNTADDDTDEDWGEVVEKDEGDSSEDEFTSSRAKRTNLAEKFFGNILPPVRPQSAGPPTIESPRTPVPAPTTSNTAPPPPPPAPASATFAPVDEIPPPPGPPPPPPPGPPPPTQNSAPLPRPTEDRGALLNAIQGGARLRKAVTNDRSGSAISGKVIGDVAPPVHINAAPDQPSSPPALAPALDPKLEHSFPGSFNPPSMLSEDTKNSHRLSVDWYAGLAADHGASRAPTLSSMREEEEDVAPANVPSHPVFNIQDADEHGSTGLMDDVDRSVGKCV